MGNAATRFEKEEGETDEEQVKIVVIVVPERVILGVIDHLGELGRRMMRKEGEYDEKKKQ